MSAGEGFYSYGLVLLAQVWNNKSFPHYMHSEVDLQIITSTWLNTMNEPGRGRDGAVGGAFTGGIIFSFIFSVFYFLSNIKCITIKSRA